MQLALVRDLAGAPPPLRPDRARPDIRVRPGVECEHHGFEGQLIVGLHRELAHGRTPREPVWAELDGHVLAHEGGSGVGVLCVHRVEERSDGACVFLIGHHRPRDTDSMGEPDVLRTERLVLVPLRTHHEAEHARASGDAADAARDTRAAEAHWREHGFGPWAICDALDGSFLGGAEVHYAGPGIDGIAPEEIETGWWVTGGRRADGIATEAMTAALADLWRRTRVESVVAYIAPENEPSRRLAARLGYEVRGPGRGRSSEPMTVYVLRRP